MGEAGNLKLGSNGDKGQGSEGGAINSFCVGQVSTFKGFTCRVHRNSRVQGKASSRGSGSEAPLKLTILVFLTCNRSRPKIVTGAA